MHEGCDLLIFKSSQPAAVPTVFYPRIYPQTASNVWQKAPETNRRSALLQIPKRSMSIKVLFLNVSALYNFRIKS